MLIEFQKTEDGITIHLPAEVVDASVFDVNGLVNVKRENGRLLILHPDAPYYDIEEMIASITDENRHEEISTGRPRGQEVW